MDGLLGIEFFKAMSTFTNARCTAFGARTPACPRTLVIAGGCFDSASPPVRGPSDVQCDRNHLLASDKRLEGDTLGTYLCAPRCPCSFVLAKTLCPYRSCGLCVTLMSWRRGRSHLAAPVARSLTTQMNLCGRHNPPKVRRLFWFEGTYEGTGVGIETMIQHLAANGFTNLHQPEHHLGQYTESHPTLSRKVDE